MNTVAGILSYPQLFYFSWNFNDASQFNSAKCHYRKITTFLNSRTKKHDIQRRKNPEGKLIHFSNFILESSQSVTSQSPFPVYVFHY